jgi:hypothetical protein
VCRWHPLIRSERTALGNISCSAGVETAGAKTFQHNSLCRIHLGQKYSRWGHNVWVARARSSSQVVQACFFGTGIEHAEHLLAIRHSHVTVPSDSGQKFDVNLAGLECRWRPLVPSKEEAVCLVVLPCATDSQAAARVLAEAYSKINEIYGGRIERRPLKRENLILSLERKALEREALLRARGDAPCSSSRTSR